MSDRVRSVMTPRPAVLPRTASVLDAARAMADTNVGPVLVVDRHETLCGVVTDRDIVVRAVATGRRLESTALGEMCTEEAATVSPLTHRTRSPTRTVTANGAKRSSPGMLTVVVRGRGAAWAC